MIDIKTLNQLILTIHEGNVKAGWWTDLKTGKSILQTRNRPEMLCLAHSELDEAYCGLVSDLMDDKLPQYKMFFVELADTAIRGLDQMGAEGVQYEEDYAPFSREFEDDREMLLYFHLLLSEAMEGYRKGNMTKYLGALKLLAYYILNDKKYGEIVLECLYAKLKYNATRADHDPKNRALADGKKF